MLHQHVFSQSTIPMDFAGEVPNIDLNKSRAFFELVVFCALAPRNFTQDVSLDAAKLPMNYLFLVCVLCVLEAAILARMSCEDVVMWNRDIYNAYL